MTHQENVKQWQHDRFGMFIHWGLYSMPARHEWIRHYEKISNEAYQKYFDNFDPDLFQPAEWAAKAKAAGMKYMVITAKHHEGFCLWDSKYTDYKATNTAAGRDLLREVIDAFRAEGIRIGLYYSLIDWHHPQFPVDKLHPMRDNEEFRRAHAGRDVRVYAEYMRNQVTELLTGYGQIDIIWFDFSYPGEDGKGHQDWESEKLYATVKKLQPQIMVNNRLDLPGDPEFTTPEQYTPSQAPLNAAGELIPWEGCQTFSGSWGYHRDENTWKSPDMLVRMLINHVCLGGNLLMNVGPNARGQFDYRAINALQAYADWMSLNNKSIYNCTAAPSDFTPPADCRYTWNPDTKHLYLHIFDWPFKAVHLDGMAGKFRYAQFLHDHSEVLMRESASEINIGLNEKSPSGALTLELPVIKPPVSVPVIELIP